MLFKKSKYVDPKKNMLNELENIFLVDLLFYTYNSKNKSFKNINSQIQVYIKSIEMNKYTSKYNDLASIKELLMYLNKKSLEKIFLEYYLISFEFGEKHKEFKKVNDLIITIIGDTRSEYLKDIAFDNRNGALSSSVVFSQSSYTKLIDSTRSESIKLFNKFKTTNISNIDLQKLKKSNRGPLNIIWNKVMTNVNIINDPSSPKFIKALAIGAIIYIITPIDAIPDVIPLAGLLDDAIIVTLAVDQIKNYLLNDENVQ